MRGGLGFFFFFGLVRFLVSVLERKTNDQSESRAISRAKLGVEESNFDSVEI